MSDQRILLQLQEAGWYIKDDYLQTISNETLSYHSTVKLLLDSDLKESGASSLPTDIGKGKSSQIKLPVILQVTNVRNVSAPKANEDSAAAPRMLRLTLTDGINYVHGLEISLIKSLSLKTAPGTKIKLHSKIPVVDSYLLLTPSNTEFIGGVVEELYQKWKLSESVSKYSRGAVLSCDGTGPPPWVPFGKKILAEKERNFKAMGDPTAKKKENDEFEVQRQQVVQELSKEGTQKVFGGGKQMLDSNVQKIINYGGFTIEEAEWALKRNKNDLKRAIQDLKRGQNGTEETSLEPTYEERGRGRGGRRGRGRGRGKDNRGPDGSDDEVHHAVMSRPSGPASLLDYLESRITEKGGEIEPKQARVEERQDYRHPRGRDFRGRRGRGRGGDWKHYSNNDNQKSEPSFSVESWPSLGEEPKNNSTPAQSDGARNATKTSTESAQSAIFSQPNYSTSQTERGGQYPLKEDRRDYKNSYSNYRSYNGPDNQEQHYHQQSGYREANQQSGYREANQQSGYREASQPHFYKAELQNYDDQRDFNRRRTEQPYYRRGMGRTSHRGTDNSSRGQPRNFQNVNNFAQPYHNDYYRGDGSANYSGGRGGGSTNYSGGRGDGSANYSGGRGGGSNKVRTVEEMELIAQFERSMVMKGCYEAPAYDVQSRNLGQGYRQEHQDNYSQGFGGTFEFHRGGDGYARRSRGGRRGRY